MDLFCLFGFGGSKSKPGKNIRSRKPYKVLTMSDCLNLKKYFDKEITLGQLGANYGYGKGQRPYNIIANKLRAGVESGQVTITFKPNSHIHYKTKCEQ